jgi:hypothetical protein
VNPPADSEAAEARHRVCWYGRRSVDIPQDVGLHTIADGHLLFCAHPMWLPIVGHQFDVRSCAACDYFRPFAAARRQPA